MYRKPFAHINFTLSLGISQSSTGNYFKRYVGICYFEFTLEKINILLNTADFNTTILDHYYHEL